MKRTQGNLLLHAQEPNTLEPKRNTQKQSPCKLVDWRVIEMRTNLHSSFLAGLTIGFVHLSGSSQSALGVAATCTDWPNFGSDVTQIDCDSQSLSGSFPDGFFEGLLHLELLNLANNSLSGELPSAIDSLTGLTSLLLGSNDFNGSIPSSWSSFAALSELDLSENHLTGNIPSSLGILVDLLSLDLSRNYLSGSIPSSLGNMTSLTMLDLSENNLTGTVPDSLAYLPDILNIYLDTNLLTGCVSDAFLDLCDELTISNGIGESQCTFSDQSGSCELQACSSGEACTTAPTNAPTQVPTPEPTIAPQTATPTSAPTISPTSVPTPGPTSVINSATPLKLSLVPIFSFVYGLCTYVI